MDISAKLHEFNDDSVGLIRDLTRQVVYYRRLLETFERDALTGFFRREKFEAYTKNLAGANSVAIIFFDVNGLKEVNDSLGHDAGDTLIQKAADSIFVFRTEKSEVFRLGGDEFAAVLFDFDKAGMEECISLWQKRLAELNKEGLVCEIAHGFALSDTGNTDFSISELLRNADEHMYENKREMKLKK